MQKDDTHESNDVVSRSLAFVAVAFLLLHYLGMLLHLFWPIPLPSPTLERALSVASQQAKEGKPLMLSLSGYLFDATCIVVAVLLLRQVFRIDGPWWKKASYACLSLGALECVALDWIRDSLETPVGLVLQGLFIYLLLASAFVLREGVFRKTEE